MNLISSLDVVKVSDRSASIILIPTIANVGEDLKNFSASYSSIRRARQKGKRNISEKLSRNFDADTLHSCSLRCGQVENSRWCSSNYY